MKVGGISHDRSGDVGCTNVLPGPKARHSGFPMMATSYLLIKSSARSITRSRHLNPNPTSSAATSTKLIDEPAGHHTTDGPEHDPGSTPGAATEMIDRVTPHSVLAARGQLGPGSPCPGSAGQVRPIDYDGASDDCEGASGESGRTGPLYSPRRRLTNPSRSTHVSETFA